MTYDSRAHVSAVVLPLTVLEGESCVAVVCVPFLKQHPLYNWYVGFRASIKLDFGTTSPSPPLRSLAHSPTYIPTVPFP